MPGKRKTSSGAKVTKTANKKPKKAEREPTSPWPEDRVGTEDDQFVYASMKNAELQEELKLRELPGPKAGVKAEMMARLMLNRELSVDERKEWVVENTNKNPEISRLFEEIMAANNEDATSFKGRSRMAVAQLFKHIPIEIKSYAQIKQLVKEKKLKGCGKSSLEILDGFFKHDQSVETFLPLYIQSKADAKLESGGSVLAPAKGGEESKKAREPILSKKQLKRRIEDLLTEIAKKEENSENGLSVQQWIDRVSATPDYVNCDKAIKSSFDLNQHLTGLLKSGSESGEYYYTDEAETLLKKV